MSGPISPFCVRLQAGSSQPSRKPGPISYPGSRRIIGDAGAWRLLVAALCCIVLGCAGSHFDGHTYQADNVAFRLAHVPPDWRSIEVGEMALAFRDDKQATTVAVNGRCGKDAEDVPLESLTQHLFIHFTEREQQQQEVMRLDGREALRTRMVAKLDGVKKWFDVVVLKKDGCVYDFLQIAAKPQDPAPFLEFVQGFSSLS